MFLRKTGILLLLTFLFLFSRAQGPLKIIFDTSGQMTSFPPPVNRYRDSISFVVKVPMAAIRQQWELFRTKLSADSVFLNKDSVSNPYRCFFGDPRFSIYLSDLKQTLDWLWEANFCGQGMVYNKSADSTIHIPLTTYVDKMLNHQYEVVLLQRNEKLLTIPLKGVILNCSDDCVYFSGYTNRLADIAKKLCCGQPLDSLQFQLIRYDPLNAVTSEWFKQTGSKDLAIVQLDNVKKAFHKLVGDTALSNIVIDINTIQQMDNWFMDWLWFSSGKAVVDPFLQITAARKKDLQMQIKAVDMRIAGRKEQLNFIDSSKKKLITRDRNLRVMGHLQGEATPLMDDNALDSVSRDSLQKILTRGTGTLTAFQTRAVLNTGLILLTHDGIIRPQKQFDAATGYQPAQAKNHRLERVTEVPSNEKPFIVIYNADSGATIKMDEKRLNFTDDPEFTQILSEQLSKIDFSSVSGTPLNAATGYLNSFNILGQLSNPHGAGGSGADSGAACLGDMQTYLLPVSADLESGDISIMLNRDIFAKYTTSNPKFRTWYQPVRRDKFPYTDSISIKRILKKDTANVITSYVNMGKLRYIQLAAGFAILRGSQSQTTVDTTSNGFRVSSSNNTASAIFGFKLYPAKNYNRDSRLIPRYPLRRFSLFGGFDIIHPLNDFYAGVGYDIVPGLSVIAGKNYYLQTRYQVENSQVVNTYRHYQTGDFFYSLTVDPTIFIQLVKLFFK